MRPPAIRSRRVLWYAGPLTGPARVDLSGIPAETRTAIRAVLSKRLAAGESVVAARYAVARQFAVTILKVEAVELAEHPLNESIGHARKKRKGR
jgi:hypothetical protein